MSINLLESPAKSGFYMTDCAVSGGTLEAFLCSALEASGGKLCVRIRPYHMEFPLPCPSGIGKALAEEQVTRLRETYPSHFSQALGTNYLTLFRQDRLYAVLFDTLHSLGHKVALCRKLDVPKIYIPDRQLRELLTK